MRRPRWRRWWCSQLISVALAAIFLVAVILVAATALVVPAAATTIAAAITTQQALVVAGKARALHRVAEVDILAGQLGAARAAAAALPAALDAARPLVVRHHLHRLPIGKMEDRQVVELEEEVMARHLGLAAATVLGHEAHLSCTLEQRWVELP